VGVPPGGEKIFDERRLRPEGGGKSRREGGMERGEKKGKGHAGGGGKMTFQVGGGRLYFVKETSENLCKKKKETQKEGQGTKKRQED